MCNSEDDSYLRLLRLAGPLMTAQIAFLGIHTTDTIVAGRLSSDTLAGVAVGGTILMTGFTFFLGLCLGISPGVAQRHGAQAPLDETRRLVASAVALSVVIWSFWALLLQFLPAMFVPWLDLTPMVQAEALAYIRAVSWGTPFLGLFFSLRNVIEGLGYSRPVMFLGVGAFLLNIPLDLALMNGWGPIPQMTAFGCGLATAIVDAAMGLGALAMIYRPPFAEVAPRWGLWPQAVFVREITWVGLPIGFALSVEHAIFAAGGLLMPQFGTAAVAAHQIALNVVAMPFMAAIGLGQATSVLVGQAAGRNDPYAVREAARKGYVVTGFFAAVVVCLLFVAPRPIASLYTHDADVLSLAVALLQIGGVFHLFDAWQALGAGALRGIKDTRMVMAITFVAYFIIGLPTMGLLSLQGGAGPRGVWWAFTVSLALAAALLGWRFHRQTRTAPEVDVDAKIKSEEKLASTGEIEETSR